MKFGTKVIATTIQPDPQTGSVTAPIYQTSTFEQSAPGEHKGFAYARTSNPTRQHLEQTIASLENGQHGIVFASGMAAIDAVLRLLKPGDEVIAGSDIYGGSHRLFTQLYVEYGIRFHFVDLTDAEALQAKLNSNTKMLWLETPSNPMLSVTDIQATADIIKGKDVLMVVDNTFASPYLQLPLDLGADIVVHSATKYLGGHSDVVLGAVVCKDGAFAERLFFIQKSVGAIAGPQDCWLVTRGIKTLHLRMDASANSAQAIARFLEQHPTVAQVYYPGLEQHPGHSIATKQMRNYGAMLSFSLVNDTLDAAQKVMSGTRHFCLAESLGGVESLIGHPATMTHASIPEAERRATGIVDSLIRISVGIEDTEDLIADLAQALDTI